MREKKSMKKISDAGYRQEFAKRAKRTHQKEEGAKLLDSDLFNVNVSKDGLQAKREKLAADRFKKKNLEGNLRSKTEVALMKKLEKKGPPLPVKQQKELFDVWGSGPSSAVQDPSIPTFAAPSKRVQKFKDYTSKSML